MFEKKVIAVGKVVGGKVEVKTTLPVETIPPTWEIAMNREQEKQGVKLVKFFNGGEK